MEKKKGHLICFFAIYCMFCGYKSTAQSLSAKEVNDVNRLINTYIYKYYKPDSVATGQCCEKGFLLVKFQVNDQAQIYGLAYTDKSPLFIQDALGVALKQVELDIFLINKLRKSKAVFLLPVVYNYTSGCNFDKISPGDKYYLNYMMTEGKSDHFQMSLLKMLAFTDGYQEGLSGVLLEPVSLGSSIH